MKNKWQTFHIGELCDVIRGRSPRPINKWITQEGIPWIKIADAKNNNSRYITSTIECIKQEVTKKSVLVYPKDLILSNSGTLAIPKFVGIKGCIHDGWVLFRNFRNLDKLFAYYLLLYERQNFVQYATGSVYYNLNTKFIKEYKVTIPSLDEQKSISYILGTIDERIELNQKINQTLEKVINSIFKSWFVDYDPVITKQNKKPLFSNEIISLFPDKFSNSSMGKIPQGWTIGTLENIANRIINTINIDDIDPKTAYISLENMPRKSIVLATWGNADKINSKKFKFSKKDVLFGQLRPYFHKVCIAPTDGICSTDIIVICPKLPELLPYVLSHVSSDKFIKYTSLQATGSMMPRTNWDIMKNYPIVIPPNEIIVAFSKHVQVMIDRIIQGIHSSHTLIELRDSLVTKLISGEIHIDTKSLTNNK